MKRLTSLAVSLSLVCCLSVPPAEAPVSEWKPRIDKPATQVSRSMPRPKVEVLKMEVTAYTLAECGKDVNSPHYGITASGKRVQEWKTVASVSGIPFGSTVYIDEFKDMPNGGVFEVQDRGGGVKGIDIYVKDIEVAKQIGRQVLEVMVTRKEVD